MRLLSRRKWINVLAGTLLLLLAIGWYLLNIFALFFTDDPNNLGRAFSGAINTSYGQYRFYKSLQHFGFGEDAKLIKKECKIWDKGRPKEPLCYMGIYGERSYQAYKSHCRWVWFESCASIEIDPIFTKNARMMGELKTVLANPCGYLPTTSTAKALKQQRCKSGATTDACTSIDFDDSLYNYDALDCANPQRTKMKVIVSVEGDAPNPSDFVTYADVGIHHSR